VVLKRWEESDDSAKLDKTKKGAGEGGGGGGNGKGAQLGGDIERSAYVGEKRARGVGRDGGWETRKTRARATCRAERTRA